MNLRDKLKFWIALNNYIEMIVGPAVAPLSLDKAVADSLSYVKAYGGTEQRNLPSEYTQVEYLESVGGQYIDTGIKIKATQAIKQVMMFSDSATTGWTGAIDAATNLLRFGVTSGLLYCQRPTTGGVSISADNNFHTFLATPTSISIDNTSQTTSNVSDMDVNFCIFAQNDARSGSITSYVAGKVKAFEITENGIIVQNLIPARRKSDNVLGMYDTVSGQFFTNAGSGNFTAGADVVPTPNAPMDIWCNNGALKVRHQSGLPLGYTLLDYIQSSGSQYIDTGIVLNSPATITTVGQFLSAVQSSPVTMWGFLGDGTLPRWGCSVYQNSWLFNLNETTPGEAYDTNAHTFVQQCTTDTYNGFVDGVSIYLREKAIPAPGVYTSNTLSAYLFARNNSGTAGNFSSSRVYSYNIVQNNVEVINLVPARRDSDSELGMYDTISGQFFTNQGTGVFTAGATVSDPVEVYADGTVETINVCGKNLFTETDAVANMAIPQNGIPNSSIGSSYTKLLPGIGGATYYVSGKSDRDAATVVRLHAYDKNGNWINQVGYQTLQAYADIGFNGTTPSGTKYLRLSYPTDNTNIQIEQGSTATAYEPYYDGGTATAEMLLSIDDYTDIQEILSGDITRKVGIKVLDGTETMSWTVQATRAYASKANIGISDAKNDTNCISTHFGSVRNANIVSINTYGNVLFYYGLETLGITSVAQWNQFLAAQYAAGTPVIIVYPLETETTESVTGQTLQVQAGNNILDITQASISGLNLEAKYKKVP